MRALALVLLLGCGSAATADVGGAPDAGADAPSALDAPLDAPDTTAAAICPAYDAHARGCFGEGTGEDFLAECQAIYAGCGGVLPELIRCRLETPCAELARCAGLGC